MGQNASSGVQPLTKSNGPNPFNVNSNIIIVGAGPAGIHMASLLKKRGYKNVKVLEKNKRVGGKSKTIVDEHEVPHDMGTCFLHNGYAHISKLIKEYGVGDIVKPGGPHGDRDIYSDGSLPESWGPGPFTLSEWVYGEIEMIQCPKSWVGACGKMFDGIETVAFLNAVLRYEKLHKEIWGDYPYGLPPRPSEKVMETINMSYGDFLKKHDLMPMLPIIRIAQAAQGYGLENIPALYGLWWVTPPLMDSILKARSNGPPTLTMLTTGYQRLWEAIQKQDDVDVDFEVDITSIDRNLKVDLSSSKGGDPIVIKALDKAGNDLEYKCDFLIMALPIKRHLHLLTDADDFEKEVFGSLKYFSLISTLMKTPEHPRGDKEQPMTIWPDRLVHETPGRLYSDRNSWISVGKGERPTTRYSIGYQFYDDFEQVKEDEAKEVLKKDLAAFWGDSKADEIEFKHQCVWEYFPHFHQDEINKMYPWKILDYQGTNRTWYIGSSACYESVEDVTSYNHLLLKLCLGDEENYSVGQMV